MLEVPELLLRRTALGTRSSSGQSLSAFPDELSLLRPGHGQNGAGLGRQLGERQIVGAAQLLLPLRGAKYSPAIGGDPLDAGEIRRGEEAVDLEQLGVALRPCRVGDHLWLTVGLFQPDPGEHLAADGFVADPEDKPAKLSTLDNMGQVEQKGANAFGVHGESIDAAYRSFLSGVASFVCFRGSFLLFVIPEGNLRFARITKATSGGEAR